MQQADILMGSAQIIMIDLVLAGDNAVVIGMAARTLAPRQRRAAILIGAFAAVALRVVATIMVSQLLGIPFLSAVGGLLVAGIAVKLLIEDEEVEDDAHKKEVSGFWHAVRIITVADVIMSVDNVLAVGGASKGHMELIIFGLLLSIPLVMFCSNWIAQALDRWPRLAELGAAVLGWTGAEMIWHDLVRHEKDTFGLIDAHALGSAEGIIGLLIKAGAAIGVVALGRYIVAQHHKKKKHQATVAVPSAE